MITIGMTAQFDSILVSKAIRRAKKGVLRKQGSFLRTTASRKIRKGKKASRPGTPPRTRTGYLKKSIRYFAGEDSVIIGPRISVIGRIGALHEFGGRVPYIPMQMRRRNNWKIQIDGHGPISNDPMRFVKIKTQDQLRRVIRIGNEIAPLEMEVIALEQEAKAKGNYANYPARPFMGPSLKDAAPHLSGLWKDSIRA